MAKPAKALKILLIGAVGVGKSSLLHQFLSTSEENNNLGAIINSTRNLIVDNEEYLLELVECEEFGFGNKVLTQDLRQSDGFLFIFNTNSKASIEYLKQCKGSIAKERTKPLSCILVGTVFINDQSTTPVSSPTISPRDAKKNTQMRARQTTIAPPPVRSYSTNNATTATSTPNPGPARSHSSNNPPITPTPSTPPPMARTHSSISNPTPPSTSPVVSPLARSFSAGGNATPPTLTTPSTTPPPPDTQDTSTRDAQELSALFDTSLTRVIFRDRQADKNVLRDLFVQLVREICASGSGSRKKPKFRFSRCDSEDLLFVTETSMRDADSETAPPSIKAATFPRLVERATYEKHPNPELVDDLLITYRAFSKATTFIDLLIARYELPKPNGIDKTVWMEHIQKAIRLRVISLLKTWVEVYPDDLNDAVFAQRLLNFVTTTLHKDHKTLAEKLESTIKSRNGKSATTKTSFTRFPPSRIKKKNVEHLLDLSALECARQLALIDHGMYKEILPLHCLHGTWSKDDPTNAVAAVIMRFNLVSSFLVSRVLDEAKPKQRAKVIEKIISIADKCKMLNNFNALIMVMSSLENTAVYRLKDTWKLISNKRKDQFLALRNVTTAKGNYAALRKAVASASQPLVPYLGVYMSMLLFIEDGNKDKTEEGLINWEKFRMLAQVIKDIRQYQQSSYMFEVVPSIRSFLCPPKETILDEEAAYTRSYTLEPGRVAMSMRIAQKPLGESTESLIPSPNSSLKWEKGKVSKLLQLEAEDSSLINANGAEEASRSIAQLYASQSNDFVALLNEWVLKMRHVSAVITETTKIINDTTRAVLSPQPALAPSPPLSEKGDASGTEETTKSLDYVATLTKSKVLEGIVEKFLTGATPTIPLALYEWFGYTLIATPQFVKVLLTSLHNIAKLKPLPELVVAISEMVGRLKAPPLDAREIWRRRKMAMRAAVVVGNLHSTNSPSISSPLQLNTLRMDCSRQVVKILELVMKSSVGSPPKTGVDTDFSFLHDMVAKLRGKEFPKKTETLQAIAILLLSITQEYPSSSPHSSPSPSPSPSPSLPIPLPTPSHPVIGYSHSAPSTYSTGILSPIPSRPGIPSALLGSRSGSPSPAFISSPNLRTSANSSLLSSPSPSPSPSPAPSPSPSPSQSPAPFPRSMPTRPASPSSLPRSIPPLRPASPSSLSRSTPPRAYSPNTTLQRVHSTSTSPRGTANRTNLSLPSTLPPPPNPPLPSSDMVRSASLNALPPPTSPSPLPSPTPHAPPLRDPASIDVSVLQSPQPPSRTPKATPAHLPLLSPSSSPIHPPTHTHPKPPTLTLTPTPTSVVSHSNPIPSPLPSRPPSGSYPCGLLGDWDNTVETFFKSYLTITYQYCASTRDQLIAYRKRLQKLKDVSYTQASGTQLGVSDDALREQLAENAQQARYIMDLVDTHEAESNQFVDWMLDHAALSKEMLLRVDLALVRRIFATFHELRNIQDEIEQMQ